jgi:WD40 repeat protein/serine/threonine protein kinase/class 3 adenylate cyclase
MNSPGPPGHQAEVEALGRGHRTGLVTLLFTDIVGSTQLKQTLGDREAVGRIQRHHALVRELLRAFPDAQEMSTAGDSFFLVFARPSDAVRFALQLQQRLREQGAGDPHAVRDRIGVHLGEVVLEAGEGKPRDLYGLHVDTAARVMSLAQGGQILLTRAAFDSARQSLKGEEIGGLGELSWLNHGPYLLKGLDEPVEICEVREAGQAVLSPPTSSEKTQRQVRADEEPVLGWRPAVGQLVPNTKWVLEEKLGEGGFGEVWLGRHQAMKERRVFKFCFRADRVRSLKREMTLFRLIKERIGDHPNIVSLREVCFDEPPYYVEMDYAEGQDLASWCAAHGGADKVPLETKLEVGAQIADALQAAHEAGVIHRDVKPGNILIGGEWQVTSDEKAGEPREVTSPRSSLLSRHASLSVRLTDFGIGQVISEEYLKGVTRAGFTQTLLGSTSSQTGTQVYMAPELLAGKPASTRSDIYSLGVVLFQLLVGDFKRPVPTDWAKHVADPLLREDLEHCFAGDPDDRFSGAGQLAKSLRAWEQRKAETARLQAERAERERMRQQAARRHKLLLASVAVAVVLVVLAMTLWYGLRRAEKEAWIARLNSYAADMKAAQVALEQNNLGLGVQLLNRHRPKTGAEDLRGLEWRYLWQAAQGDAVQTWPHPCMVTGAHFSPDGTLAVSAGFDGFLRVWDLANRQPQPVAQFERGVPDDDVLFSFCFSPDGRTLASAHRDGAIVVLDCKTWQPVRKLVLPSDEKRYLFARTCLVYSPDGRWLAAALPGGVRIWDTRDYQTSFLPTGSQWRIAFAPDNTTLGVCGGDLVALWDVGTRMKVKELAGLHGPAKVAFSPQGGWLAAANWDGQIALWNLPRGQRVWTHTAHRSRVYGLAFSSRGEWLVSGGFDQQINIWEVATQKKLRTLRGHLNEVWSVEFSSDDRFLLSSSKDGTIRLWEPRAEAQPTRWWLDSSDSFLGFAADGRRFVSITTNGTTLRHWDGPRLVKTVPLQKIEPKEGVFRPVLSPRSLNLFTGTTNGTVYVHSAETGRAIRSLKLADQLNGLTAVSPDERWLAGGVATSGDLRGLWAWDASSGAPAARFPEYGWPYGVMAFSCDGHFLAAGTTNHAIKVWDLELGRSPHTLTGHAWHALALAFSGDGTYLATGSWDGDARVWDVVTGKQVAGPFSGHGSGVNAACLSPDGKTLVTSGDDRSVRLWHVPTGREMLVLNNVRGSDPGLLSPSGQLLLVWDDALQAVRLESVPTLAEIDLSEKRERHSP